MEKFAFIVHPLEASDVVRKFSFANRWSEEWIERFIKHSPPLVTDHLQGIRGADSDAEGWLIGTPLTSRQMLQLPLPVVIRKIIAAGCKAQRMGAKIVGLGAMTSVVGDAGITIARQLSIPVTTGNSYTVATAVQATFQAASLMGIDVSRAKVCIVGATGAIGSVCARLVAPMVGKLLLVGRNQDKLEGVAATVFSESSILCDVTTDSRRALRQADIIISVSGSSEALIFPEDLKPGAVVCDVARPRDVAKIVSEVRQDVLVIEGGLVQVPHGWKQPVRATGLPGGIVYACMAETMVLALERRYECYTLGRSISVEQVREIDLLAQKHGFQLAGFRSFERSLSLEDVAVIRQRAEHRKKVIPLRPEQGLPI